MKFFSGFALAFSMLTILPFFKVHNFFKGINGYSALSYPLIGLIIGLLLWLFSSLLSPFVPSFHLGAIIFALWIFLTGALHLDGLSDTIDGLFVPKEKAFEVMKDSHIGGMGAIFTFTFLLLKFSLLCTTDFYAYLPLVLLLSRLNATLAIYLFKYSGGGMGALTKKELQLWQVLCALAIAIIFSFLFHTYLLIFISLCTLLLAGIFFAKRLGGLSGDIYGFIIEVSELIMLESLLLFYSS